MVKIPVIEAEQESGVRVNASATWAARESCNSDILSHGLPVLQLQPSALGLLSVRSWIAFSQISPLLLDFCPGCGRVGFTSEPPPCKRVLFNRIYPLPPSTTSLYGLPLAFSLTFGIKRQLLYLYYIVYTAIYRKGKSIKPGADEPGYRATRLHRK